MKHILFFLFCCLLMTACAPEDHSKKTIGIIVPLEHKALTEIISGFSDELKKQYPYPVKIDVSNAQNDLNLQRAIIQQMRDTQASIIIPIGTGATEMTLSMVHDQSILSLASTLSQKDRSKILPCHTAIVHDEIPPEKIIAFIHDAYPAIKKLTLIHSTADKIFPDISTAIKAGTENHIEITTLMAATLPDLMSIGQSIPADSDGIFVLKDNLIVSGISTLAKIAHDKKIVLITSDEGTVEEGADFALGVHERDIGKEGAIVAAAILQGKSPCDLPIVEMNRLTLFINPDAMRQTKYSLLSLMQTAHQLQYQTELTDKKGEK